MEFISLTSGHVTLIIRTRANPSNPIKPDQTRSNLTNIKIRESSEMLLN